MEPRGTLVGRWTRLDGVDVFYRESEGPVSGSPVMMHVHGFGLSGRYLLPTAERLASEFHTLVPDLPGFGRSGRTAEPLDVPGLARAAAAFLDDRDVRRSRSSATRWAARSSASSPTCSPNASSAPCSRAGGGVHNQPLHRAIRQLARDGLREPVRLMNVAFPTTYASACRARCGSSVP